MGDPCHNICRFVHSAASDECDHRRHGRIFQPGISFRSICTFFDCSDKCGDSDSFGFFLTHKYGQIIIDKLIPKWDGKIFNIEKNLRNYAFGTIFLTRVAGPFAPYVNFLSGLIAVKYYKFLLADFLGNAIGAIFFFVIGYALGNYWQAFLDDTWLVTAIISVLFVAYVIYKTIIKKRAEKI